MPSSKLLFILTRRILLGNPFLLFLRNFLYNFFSFLDRALSSVPVTRKLAIAHYRRKSWQEQIMCASTSVVLWTCCIISMAFECNPLVKRCFLTTLCISRNKVACNSWDINSGLKMVISLCGGRDASATFINSRRPLGGNGSSVIFLNKHIFQKRAKAWVGDNIDKTCWWISNVRRQTFSTRCNWLMQRIPNHPRSQYFHSWMDSIETIFVSGRDGVRYNQT